MEGEGKGQRDEGREYWRPQRRCGEPERRRAGDEGRRAWATPLQPAAGSRGGSEVPRLVGAGGAEGEGAAAASRDLGEGVGRAAPRCAAGTTRTN